MGRLGERRAGRRAKEPVLDAVEGAARPSSARSGNNRSSIIHPPGFTLIELLVVIAIVTLLMAILLPVARRARNQARAVVCCAHVKQWGTTLALYVEENEGRLPRGGDEHIPLSLLRGLYTAPGVDPNKPTRYRSVRTEGITHCPMTAKRNDDGPPFSVSEDGEVWLEGRKGATFVPWEITRPRPPLCMSYGLNGLVFTPMFEGVGATHGKSIGWGSMNVSSVKGRANIPLLFDSPQSAGQLVNERRSPPREESSPFDAPCINRHKGAINVLFLDWSVRRIGLKGLWTLKWHLHFDTAGPWTKAGGVQPQAWPEWMRGFKDY